MSSYPAGSTATLTVEWREYPPDGPFVDVTDVTITIVPVLGGAPVIGPTSDGVTNPAVGVNGYPWVIPADTEPGGYVVIWSGIDPGTGDPVEAAEQITVTTQAAAGALGTVPCGGSWTPSWCGTACPPEPEPGEDPLVVAQVLADSVTVAAEILYSLSGQRFGQCALTLRPCRRDCWGGQMWPFDGQWWEWAGGGWPALVGGSWFNLACGGCPGSCSCNRISEVLLPGPVGAVTQVLVDGLPLTPDVDYRLDDSRLLLRLGGHQWPQCNDLNLADTQPGTWSVTATFGEELPMSGRRALGELACQLAKACLGRGDCILPSPVQQLVRQGITMTFLDPSDVYAAGRLGLRMVDMFLQAFNPQRLASAPQVYDVDGPGWRRAGA